MSRIFLLGIFSLVFHMGLTQEVTKDSTLRYYELGEVIITKDKLIDSAIGLNKIEIDTILKSQTAGQSLSELFRLTAGGQIRSFGSNGLTTPSFRGTGGSHTSVLWNGINLQSPLSGQLDLSLIPVTFTDDISIQKGGAGSIFGSGAIGGTIQLDNKIRFNKGLRISTNQEVGSFSNHFQQYQVDWSNQSFENSTQIFRRTLANDFPYQNIYRRPVVEEIRQNASISQWGVLQQNNIRINHSNIVGFKLWFQDNEVEIPESILAGGDSEAVQNDQFLRGILFWNYDRQKFSLTLKQSVNRQELRFVDPSILTDATNTFNSWVTRVETAYEIDDQWNIVSGINALYEEADVDAFGDLDPDRSNVAIFNSVKYLSKNESFRLALTAREEIIDGEFTPFTPSIGFEYLLLKNLTVSGNIARNYRVPTFNDLFWMGQGGIGNPDLVPEISWSQEGAVQLDLLSKESLQLGIKTTVFNSLVNNWILWRPITSDVWTPDNIKQVSNRGIEMDISLAARLDDFSIQGNLLYNYTRSTNEEISDNGNTREIGKQLFYTPIHDGSLLLKTSFRSFSWAWTFTYTGKQFTDGENSDLFALPAYTVLNTFISKQIKFDDFSGSVRLSINNILNNDYENRRGYPLYGRNFSIGLNINYNKKRNE